MKILVIEDDKFFQKFYSTKLKESGYEVDIASNGQEGLQKITTYKPDLILLDLVMPVMDGFEFLKNLPTLGESYKQIPILVFSTLAQETDILKAKSLGATDYTNKSFFEYDKLLSKIKSFEK